MCATTRESVRPSIQLWYNLELIYLRNSATWVSTICISHAMAESTPLTVSSSKLSR